MSNDFSGRLTATFVTNGLTEIREFGVSELVIAGWTGRDIAAVERHIRELEDLGVKRPSSIPVYYRVSARRLTTATSIEVAGDQSSGEAEFVLLQSDGRLWVGVGSDHTDRKVETYNITVSKQMCEKPVASTFWAFEDVAGHWDSLVLASEISEHGTQVSYQTGTVASMRHPQDLIDGYGRGPRLAEGTLMFCGTLAAQGGIRPADRFTCSLYDPVRERRISLAYDVQTLPVNG